ncbi:MAG: hypothetical protein D6719_00225 [Candidatus Dadabacteria bacterium]|nr:MAG: hypothetical protein D6719_00225 [Candidatus Dadabacteria bacterium]
MTQLQLPLFPTDTFKSIIKRIRRPAPQSPPDQLSNRALKDVWLRLRKRYFPGRPDIDEYQVVWSRRAQKRTLASCNIESKRVTVARELNYKEHFIWLEPLLFHEMCHAYLEDRISGKNGKIAWHGKEFKALEKLHPGSRRLDQWIKKGGWSSAVRSDRAKRAHIKRKLLTVR